MDTLMPALIVQNSYKTYYHEDQIIDKIAKAGLYTAQTENANISTASNFMTAQFISIVTQIQNALCAPYWKKASHELSRIKLFCHSKYVTATPKKVQKVL